MANSFILYLIRLKFQKLMPRFFLNMVVLQERDTVNTDGSPHNQKALEF
jgi:hypothetical protein